MNARLTVQTLLAQGTRQLAAGTSEASASLALNAKGQSSAARPVHLAQPSGASTSPALDAQLLLAHCLGVTRTYLRVHPEGEPAEAQTRQYRQLLARRAAGEPLAYILGRKEFWTLELEVGPDVLVPRPETEFLVERALALEPGTAARVADLGTGSGAIALALASERPGWQIVATDVSDRALAGAAANARRLGLSRIEFLLGSWFAPLAGRTFDLIVSNPPYIAADDPAMQDPALKHEPSCALSPGADALLCLREIIAAAPVHLDTAGWLVLEHGAGQAEAVAHELVARGFRHVRSHRDLAGHERMTEAQRT